MKLKIIHWRDARGSRAEWEYTDSITDEGLCMISSVGWVVKETKSYIHLAPHVGYDPGQICGDMVIPKSSIAMQNTIKVSDDFPVCGKGGTE